MIRLNKHNNLQYSYTNTTKNIMNFGHLATNPIYQKDEAYRAKLAQNTGMPATNLQSVIGAEELKDILENELKPENFSTGKDFENVNSGIFRANLHIHTTHSDGEMSVQDLLDQAAEYSKDKPKPIIIAITDHDTLEGVREAIKIIAKNPKKYENIKFVTGIEFSSFYYLTPQDKHPLELIGYCINPFETDKPASADAAKFVKEMRVKNKKYLEEIVKVRLNGWERKTGIRENELTTPEEFRKQSKYADILGSPGFLSGIEEALNKIFQKHGWQRSKNDRIDKIKNKHTELHGDLGINPGTPSVKEIAQVVKASGNGFLGIAHPGRTFKNVDDWAALLSDFQKTGVEGVEANYQYNPNKSTPKSIGEINKAAEQVKMLKTGGIDNHSDNIFIN